MSRQVALAGLILALGLGLPGPALAAGPWRAQVVDAETGRPLEGVVVLAYWLRYQPSLGGWAGGAFHAGEEVVTGADGRFAIRSRWSYTIPLLVKVSGPEWVIFRPGHGRWRFRRSEDWEKFARGEEVVIEMPPLKTHEERLKFHDTVIRPVGVVPPERMPRLTDAWEQDRAFLGLGR